jgi:hypothetical protein
MTKVFIRLLWEPQNLPTYIHLTFLTMQPILETYANNNEQTWIWREITKCGGMVTSSASYLGDLRFKSLSGCHRAWLWTFTHFFGPQRQRLGKYSNLAWQRSSKSFPAHYSLTIQSLDAIHSKMLKVSPDSFYFLASCVCIMYERHIWQLSTQQLIIRWYYNVYNGCFSGSTFLALSKYATI